MSKDIKKISGWQPIETRPTEDCVNFLVLLPGNDMAKYLILQVSGFEENIYADHLDGCIDWSDRILNATHWMPLPKPPKSK